MGLEILSKHGVCCALHVSYPRYRDRLDPGLLGFDLNSSMDRAVFRAPSIAMLADALKPISSIEQKARAAFSNKTLSLAHGVGLRFCPVKGLSSLMQVLRVRQEEFSGAAVSFVSGFDRTVSEMRTAWQQTVDRQTGFSEEIRKKLLDRVLLKFPNRAPPLNAFSMDVSWLELKTPDTPGLTGLDDVEAAAAAEAWSEMRSRAVDKARQFSDTFVTGCRMELVRRLQEFYASMRVVVENGKPINKRTVARVREFVENMSVLNFANDSTINGWITQLQESFGGKLDSAVPAGIHDNEIIRSVSDCIGDTADRIEAELSIAYDDGAADRVAAVVGTPVPLNLEIETGGLSV